MRHLLNFNAGWICVAASLALTVVGFMTIETAVGADSTFYKRQIVFTGISLMMMVIVAIPHYKRVCEFAFPMLLGVILLLVIVMLPGMPRFIVPVINGARRWINFYFMNFQPSEAAKVVFVLALAQYLRFRADYRRWTGLIVPFVIAIIPMGLIMIEPDLGTSLIFLPVTFAMLLAAGARKRHLGAIILVGMLLAPVSYLVMKPHQKARIDAIISQMMGDTQYKQTIGFQGWKAVTLAGAGQITGTGHERAGTLLKFNSLPEAHNDMIFAVICLRWGLLGGLGVLLLYLILLISGLMVAISNRDPFARLIVVGLITIIFTQMFVNIGMTIGLLPITGMTLPFISYGGSSLLANYALLGLILSASGRQDALLRRPSFEFAVRGSTVG